jgi:ABC-2 type transport system permease protein
LANHFEALLRGIINTTDIAYYLLWVVTFLVLSIRRLDAERRPQ